MKMRQRYSILRRTYHVNFTLFQCFFSSVVLHISLCNFGSSSAVFDTGFDIVGGDGDADTVSTLLWPLPATYNRSNATSNSRIELNATNVTWKCEACSSLVARAVDRYKRFIFLNGTNIMQEERIFEDSSNNQHTAAALIVECAHDSVSPLQAGFDESYTIHAESTGTVKNRIVHVTMSAKTEFGLIRALETLSQLITWSAPSSNILKCSTLFCLPPAGKEEHEDRTAVHEQQFIYSIQAPPFYIADAPAYSWRAIMLDTGRNFLPVSAILRTLDGMEQNKLNALVWHLTDDGSFPVEFNAHPISQLAKKGSICPSFATYTKEEVHHIVSYAKDRGIRVVPVLDIPGHSQSWSKGIPSIFPSCPDVPAHEQNVLDPTNNATYEVIAAIFEEMNDMFPDEWWGIEGDEVQCSCVLKDAKILSWMQDNSPPFQVNKTCDTFIDSFYNPSIHQLQVYLTSKVLEMAQALSVPRKLLLSQYIWDRRSPAIAPLNATFEAFEFAYGDSPFFAPPQQPIAAGFHILDMKSFYFDTLNFQPFQPDPAQLVYDADPQVAWNLSSAEVKFVMGGMASYWTTQFDDSTLDSFLWPRASAMAERLWSSKNVIPAPTAAKWDKDILPRLIAHRCRMLRRGIKPYSLATSYCVLQNPEST